MPSTANQPDSPARPLRLWPGVVIVAGQWLARFGLPVVAPDLTMYGVLAGVAGGLALIVWWLFFSRAAWIDRLAGVGAMAAAMAVTWPLLHVSMATGAMGFIFPMLALPGLCLAFVLWALASPRLPASTRRPALVAAILLASGVWTLVRTGGFNGSFENDLAWRWTPTPEQRLLAQVDAPLEAARSETRPPAAVDVAPVAAAIPVAAPANGTPAAARPVSDPSRATGVAAASDPSPRSAADNWPGFRGRERDGVVRGVRIDTDWAASPPQQLWRRAIGPGWSSFAVHGDLLYTQEQRGGDEIVAAYRVSTGAPVWQHRDQARFWESNGGAGPRGTPTLAGGRVYAFGATGLLNVLDAADGRVIWSRNVSADSRTTVPDWGFSSSPLLVDDLVVVAAAGTLVAYDRTTGEPRWQGPDGGAGYSSPHVVTIDGVTQIVLLDAHGATSVSPSDGSRLWEFTVPPSAMAAPIVQPALTADGDILISDGTASGMYRVTASRGPDGWTVKERWKSTGLKPYYNDFVVHDGHAYGFDGTILSCIDLTDGTRKWKGGRYGAGQLVLLADQDLLLVISEDGELALVAAAPDKYTPVARVPAIESKTWNHPVLVGEALLVRNGEEMAAFRLAPASR